MDPWFLLADKEGSDQTGLSESFSGRTLILLVLSCCGSNEHSRHGKKKTQGSPKKVSFLVVGYRITLYNMKGSDDVDDFHLIFSLFKLLSLPLQIIFFFACNVSFLYIAQKIGIHTLKLPRELACDVNLYSIIVRLLMLRIGFEF